MIDKKNVALAKQKKLPPCESGVNYPMHEFFNNLKGNELSIKLVELGSKREDGIVPDSAYNYKTWWAGYNTEKPSDRTHTLAWLNAGWRVESRSDVSNENIPDKDKKVVFVRFK